MLESDIELVNKIKEEDDQDALLELVDRHTGVFYKTLQEYIPHSIPKASQDEFFMRKEFFFYDAAKTFKEDKGVKFSTWLVNSTRYKCLSERTRLANLPEFYEFGEECLEIQDERVASSPNSRLELKEDFDEILKGISQKHGSKARTIFQERYLGGNNGAGKTFKEIAKDLGVSIQNIQNTHAKILVDLKETLSVA